MHKSLQQFVITALITGFSVFASSAHAQQSGPVQQGNGAYVLKADRAFCIPNSLLGITGLGASDCLEMNQSKFVVTPSGNSMSVWNGIAPVNARPTQRIVFKSTMLETAETAAQGKIFDTVAITEPDGTVTLTLTSKNNGKSKKK